MEDLYLDFEVIEKVSELASGATYESEYSDASGYTCVGTCEDSCDCSCSSGCTSCSGTCDGTNTAYSWQLGKDDDF